VARGSDGAFRTKPVGKFEYRVRLPADQETTGEAFLRASPRLFNQCRGDCVRPATPGSTYPAKAPIASPVSNGKRDPKPGAAQQSHVSHERTA
jgi:hypothetical protein